MIGVGLNPTSWRSPRRSPADLGGTVYGDSEYYGKAPYLAFASPWAAAANDLAHGTDYSDTIRVYEDTFPAGTIITWRWPDHRPTATGVYGYMHLACDIIPTQASNLAEWTETVDYALSGYGEGHNILRELFLLANPADALEAALFEVGWLLKTNSHESTYVRGTTAIGSMVDDQGRTWDCFNTGPNPNGAPFIVFIPAGDAPVSGALEAKSALAYLVAQSVIAGTEWIKRVYLGVEPQQGSGSMRVDGWSISVTGAETGPDLLASYQALNTANWTKEGTTAPDADSILETSATSVHGIYRATNTAAQAAGNYRFRADIEPVGRQKILMQVFHNFTNRALAWFDLDTGTVSNVIGTGAAGYIVDLGGGKKRVILDVAAQANDTLRPQIRMRSDDGAQTSYAGNTSKGLNVTSLWMGKR